MSALRALGRAGRAVWNEVMGFRFQSPAACVPEAGQPGSLRFHLDAPELFHGAMRIDDEGVPFQESRTFRSYNPAYVALYGLQSLDAYARGTETGGRRGFERQVSWLRAHAQRRDSGAAVWTYDFEWREHDCVMRPPWISSMAQGLAMSALVRAHRLSGDKDDLALAHAAALPFTFDIEDGGVRDRLPAGAIYEEYAARPATRVLDGFLFSLLGLFDLAEESGDAEIGTLFTQGVNGLVAEMARWDAGYWSWYGRQLYLAPPAYHAINRALLASVATLAGRQELLAVSERWNPSRLSFLGKVSVYARFVSGKQWSRVRDRLIVGPAVRRREASAVQPAATSR